MSLSSRKSTDHYNRAATKIATVELVDQELVYDQYGDWEEPCREHCCNPSLKDLYRNRLVYFLTKLHVISGDMADRFWMDFLI